MDPSRFVWLHGFASGPASSKGRYLRSRLATRGAWLSLPDLNQPAFRTLTVGRMVEQVEALWEETRPAPLVLFGSSLGGFTAAHVAALHPERCRALVLLAPAFALARRWEARMGPALVQQWESQGAFEFDHYAYGRKEALGAGFLADARQREEFPLPACPTLVIQGLRDEVVDPALAPEFCRRMAAAGRTVELHQVDEGHELTGDLPGLWARIERFLDASGCLSGGVDAYGRPTPE